MAIIIDGEVIRKGYVPDNPLYDVSDTMQATTDIRDSSDLAELHKDMNSDHIDPKSKMSGIDMRSRLHYIEISGILAIDTLVQFRFLTMSTLSLTRQKKRLAVSLDGKGREETVKLVSGKNELDARSGTASYMDKLKGLIGNRREP